MQYGHFELFFVKSMLCDIVASFIFVVIAGFFLGGGLRYHSRYR